MTNHLRTWARRALALAESALSHLGLAVVLLVAGYAGIIGIDFGSHWDEPTMIRVVKEALARGELLPRWYNYPSVSFGLSLASAAREIVSMSLLPSLRGSSDRPLALGTLIGGHDFLLRTRVVFLLVSLLAVVWVYWLVWDSQKSRFQATLAAGLVGFSWEVGYHARWIAPDAVMMQLGALTLLAMHLALSRGSPRWSWVAAGAAGFACGTKYPGGALLLPVCLCAAVVARQTVRRAAGVLRAVAGALAVFAAAYLITTPGTLLEYTRFLTDVRAEYNHYHEVGHPGGHSIEPGMPHLRAAGEYLFCAALSRYPILAMTAGALAVAGAVALVRERRIQALPLLAFPLVYVGYMSLQRAIIIRNLLVVLPFLAFLAARGAAVIIETAGRLPRGRVVASALFSAMLAANAASLVRAARTVARNDDPVKEMIAYVNDHPRQRFLVTARVERELRGKGHPLPANVVARSEGPDEIALFHASEAMSSKELVAYHHATALRWFGSQEVNYNYYPSWGGRDRIVAMKLAGARALFPDLWKAD